MQNNKQNKFSSFFNTMLKMRKILDQTLEDNHGDNISTMLQVQALKTIKDNSPITASELATRLQMSPSAITQMADRLVKSKLITRSTDKNDRRLILLTLTNQGEQHLALILKKMEQKANKILAPISEKELQTVVAIFENFLEQYEK